jgi:hypothetical protein
MLKPDEVVVEGSYSDPPGYILADRLAGGYRNASPKILHKH